jgi:hypothetical protein
MFDTNEDIDMETKHQTNKHSENDRVIDTEVAIGLDIKER